MGHSWEAARQNKLLGPVSWKRNLDHSKPSHFASQKKSRILAGSFQQRHHLAGLKSLSNTHAYIIHTIIWKCVWELQETKLCNLLAASWLKLSCALFSGGADCECPPRILHAKTLRQIVTCFNPVRPEMRAIPHTPHFHKRVDVHSSHAWVFTSPRTNYLLGTWCHISFHISNNMITPAWHADLGPNRNSCKIHSARCWPGTRGCQKGSNSDPHQQGTMLRRSRRLVSFKKNEPTSKWLRECLSGILHWKNCHNVQVVISRLKRICS